MTTKQHGLFEQRMCNLCLSKLVTFLLAYTRNDKKYPTVDVLGKLNRADCNIVSIYCNY